MMASFDLISWPQDAYTTIIIGTLQNGLQSVVSLIKAMTTFESTSAAAVTHPEDHFNWLSLFTVLALLDWSTVLKHFLFWQIHVFLGTSDAYLTPTVDSHIIVS